MRNSVRRGVGMRCVYVKTVKNSTVTYLYTLPCHVLLNSFTVFNIAVLWDRGEKMFTFSCISKKKKKSSGLLGFM